MELKGKTALVCGSSAGIGKASAIELSKMGATIILLARNEEKLKKVLLELDNSQNQNHTYLTADFSDRDSLDDVCDELSSKTIQILINNTGGPAGGPILDAKPSAFLSTFNQHLIANHKITQSVVDGMKKSGYGRIINIISTSVKGFLFSKDSNLYFNELKTITSESIKLLNCS